MVGHEVVLAGQDLHRVAPHELQRLVADRLHVLVDLRVEPAQRDRVGERDGEGDPVPGLAFERLAPSKVPRRIFIVDALPKGPTGKLQRTLLAQQLTRAGSALGALGGVGKSP